MRYLIIAVILFGASCELIVDIDMPYDGDQIVVNAVQHSDSTWYVDLSLTRNIVGPEYYWYVPVNNATVTIHNPDGTTEVLTSSSGDGVFRGKSYPQGGQKYSLSVQANNLGSVESEMTMPEVVPIVDVQWDSTEVDSNWNYFTNVPFTVTFHDPEGVKNYYAVQVYSVIETTYQYPNENEPAIDTIGVIREVPIEGDPGIATEDERKFYFGDHTFEGQTYTGHFNTQFFVQPSERILEIRVLLLSMSEENFKYQETRRLQDDVDGDPFAQPVQIFSNMSNGFGIFAGSSVDSRAWTR